MERPERHAMSDAGSSRKKQLVLEALDLPPAQRAAFVAARCVGDPDLEAQVMAMLRVDSDRLQSTLSHGHALAATTVPEIPEAVPGAVIGPYHLMSCLGEGGFGVVWLAERREPMVQRVALKIIKPGMDSRAVIARFEQERQALAVMDHPNVAKVFDGGMTPAGRPYFVMEYVKGEPITDSCERLGLTIKQRLELFIPVCQAVQHAHHKGIIHRDLKPSNILVEEIDGKPTPKVIDFGIAKAIDQTHAERSVVTEEGRMVGTYEYMSPEQAGGEADVDTRTDVYSLGVVLYELLSGTLPFDPKSLRAAAYAEIQRIIREVEPPRPSTRLSTADDQTGAEIARARQAEREKIAGELRRELEWIPLKALRKDRARRYASAESLAADVRRYLEGRPLEAAPESRAYLLRKFVRRNRLQVSAVAAVFLALAGGLGATLWMAQSARNEAKRADANLDLAMVSLRSHDPYWSAKMHYATSDGMQQVMTKVDSGAFADQPESAAAILRTISITSLDTGKLDTATTSAERSLAIERSQHRGDHPHVAECLNRLGLARKANGRSPDAVQLLSDSLQMYRRLYRRDHRDIAMVLTDLAAVLVATGQFKDAARLFDEALEMDRRLFAGDHPFVAGDLNNAGKIRDVLRQPAEAETFYTQALEMFQRLHQGDDPNMAITLDCLAQHRAVKGELKEAESLETQALNMRRRMFRGDHPETLSSINNLAGIYLYMQRPQDAEPLLTESLDMARRLYVADHPRVEDLLHNLGSTRMMLNRPSDAEPLLVQALEMQRRLSSNSDSDETAKILSDLSHVRAQLGRAAEAIRMAEEALAMGERVLPADHPDLQSIRENLRLCRELAETQKGK